MSDSRFEELYKKAERLNINLDPNDERQRAIKEQIDKQFKGKDKVNIKYEK